MNPGETYYRVTVWERSVTKSKDFHSLQHATNHYHQNRNAGRPVRMETIICVMEGNRD